MKKEHIFNYLQISKYSKNLPDFKEKKTQAFTTIAFTLFALSFFGIFSISPTLSTIAQLQKQLEDNKFVNEQLKQKIINLRSLQNKYALLQKDIPFVLSAIPKTPTVSLLVAQIQAIGEQNNVAISHLQVYQVELAKHNLTNAPEKIVDTPNKYTSFAFSLDAKGESSNISSFLDSLINFERIVTIDTLNITQDSTNAGSIRVVFKGKAYFKI